LPGLTKGVGGVQVVVDLANFLIAQGVDARTVVLGDFDYGTLSTYGEPMYFNLYHCKSEREFLECFSVRPRLVVATLFATAPAAYKFARRVDARLVNFVQGYEFYFTDGRFYEHVRDSYYLADCSIATSKWLAENVRRHLPNGDVEQLPLGIDLNLFYPAKTRQGSTRMRVGMVIRSAPDKGQYVLRELCDRLLRYQQDITLTIFVPRDYNFASAWSYSDQECVEVPLPADRVTIASALRAVDVFIDASLHEGYGLFPLEAMACGACVIASDSGGTTQFLSHGRNGYIVSAVNQPDEYLRYIEALTENRSLLSSLQDAALQTAMLYKDSSLFASYGELFTRMLSEYPGTSATAGLGACSTELLPLFRP
jgi:glycosyltransferase involved in cell wall biosynthesis